jgi:hypothetical protein
MDKSCGIFIFSSIEWLNLKNNFGGFQSKGFNFVEFKSGEGGCMRIT